jgi:hypothetical protein
VFVLIALKETVLVFVSNVRKQQAATDKATIVIGVSSFISGLFTQTSKFQGAAYQGINGHSISKDSPAVVDQYKFALSAWRIRVLVVFRGLKMLDVVVASSGRSAVKRCVHARPMVASSTTHSRYSSLRDKGAVLGDFPRAVSSVSFFDNTALMVSSSHPHLTTV